jgi:hypothetical protein
MSRKALTALESQYMRALSYAILFRCSLTVEQFAASHAMDPEELDALKDHLESRGVNA